MKHFEVDPTRRIAAMKVKLNGTLGRIYGIRFVDDNDELIMDADWFTPSEGNEYAWMTSKVPEGREIIGVHASHDGDYLTSLGMTVWEPNPDAKKNLQ